MTTADPGMLGAIESISRILDESGVPYFIGGSFASSIRGELRTTNDIDIICNFSDATLDQFLNKLAPLFIVDQISARESYRKQQSFNILVEESYLKIDIFCRIDPFIREELKRAAKVAIPGSTHEIMVASTEDIILSKLRWFKMGGETSERQWRDIMGVLRVQHDNLDMPYLKKWASDLELSPLLEKALQEGYK